ncbi:unnamed protein product [Pedinophyceae sp. YPF-701]|nr:unnamed protein product [Pedinophyceae sp. YPF-701]
MPRKKGQGAAGKAKAEPAPAPAPAAQPVLLVEDKWAQCEKCDKWRRLPMDHVIDENEPWFCHMNPDKTWNKCSVPEENYAAGFVAPPADGVAPPATEAAVPAGPVLTDAQILKKQELLTLAQTAPVKVQRFQQAFAKLVETRGAWQQQRKQATATPGWAWEALFAVVPDHGASALSSVNQATAAQYFQSTAAGRKAAKMKLEACRDAMVAAAQEGLPLVQDAAVVAADVQRQQQKVAQQQKAGGAPTTPAAVGPGQAEPMAVE